MKSIVSAFFYFPYFKKWLNRLTQSELSIKVVRWRCILADRRFQQLCQKSLEELYAEHPCMGYDAELMKRAAVKHNVVVHEEEIIGSQPRLRQVVADAIDTDEQRIVFLAGYIVEWEHTEDVHSTFTRMSAAAKAARARHNRSHQPQLTYASA